MKIVKDANTRNVQLLEACKTALGHVQILGSGQRSPYSNAEMCEILGKAIARVERFNLSNKKGA